MKNFFELSNYIMGNASIEEGMVFSDDVYRVPDLFNIHYSIRYEITYASDRIACVSKYHWDNTMLRRGAGVIENTIILDVMTMKEITFDDLFRYPKAAKSIISGIAIRKYIDAIKKKKSLSPDLLDYEFRVNRIMDDFENIVNYDYADASFSSDGVALDFSWWSDMYSPFAMVNRYDGGEACLDLPIVIDWRSLEAAVPNPRYF